MQAQPETRLQNPELQQSNMPARQQNQAHQSETVSIFASGNKTSSQASPPTSLLINCHVNNNSNNQDSQTARQHKKCHAPTKKEMPNTRRYSQCWKIGTGNKNQFHGKDQNEGGESSNPNANNTKKLDYLKNIQIVSNRDRKEKKLNGNENANSPNLNGRGKNLMQQTFVEYHPVGQCKRQKLIKQSGRQTFQSSNNNGKMNPNSMKAKIFQKMQNKTNDADLEIEKKAISCLSQDIKDKH